MHGSWAPAQHGEVGQGQFQDNPTSTLDRLTGVLAETVSLKPRTCVEPEASLYGINMHGLTSSSNLVATRM